MSRHVKVSFLLFLIVFPISLSASIVTMKAKAPSHSDADKAKELCATQATKRSIEVFVQEFISPATEKANYEKIHRAIYKPYQDFVSGYEVVEMNRGAEVTECQVKVELNDLRIKSQLAALGIKSGNGSGKNKVMVMASESIFAGYFYGGFFGPLYHRGIYDLGQCESAIVAALTGGGVSVMDTMFNADELARIKTVGKRYDQYDEKLDQLPLGVAADLAKAADPEVGIVVSCKASADASRGKVSAHFSSVTATAVCNISDIKLRSMLGSVRAQATKPHIDPQTAAANAMDEACRKAGSDIVAKITKNP